MARTSRAKPDAFARAVMKLIGNGMNGVWPSEAEDLLRAHHRKIERLVRRMHGKAVIDGGAYQLACADLLTALRKMRQP